MKKPDSQQMKSAARLYAVQALFQMEAGDASLDEVRDQFVNHRFGEETEGGNFIRGNLNLFESLIYQAVNNQAKIDQMTDRALVAKWPIDRIDSTLRALFRAAGSELVTGKTPPKVVISEFVDIAKAFFPEGQKPGFVNAVLDHMAREIQPRAFGI